MTKSEFNELINPKNRSLQFFIAFLFMLLLFIWQYNRAVSFLREVEIAKKEVQRAENNRLASIDSVKQHYDAKTGVLTAEIRGYQVTIDELETKYKDLFGDYLKEKNKKPRAVVDIRYRVRESIVGVDIDSTPVDSMGNGVLSFRDSINFSPGNSRVLKGSLPYQLSVYSKKDSSLLNYSKQNFYARTLPDPANFLLEQEMSVNTGLLKDKKTGEVKVWAKTSYPGVTFNLLNGATVEEDEETQEAMKSLRKSWGLGFSLGTGAVYTGSSLSPGFFAGVGLNYSPKNLQFGK